MMGNTLVRIGVTVAWLALPVAAFGQISQSSGIAGVVRDSSGAVMPGVTVEAASSALIEKVRTAVTDSQGVYRVTDLRPGLYTVTFTLTGFSTVRRDGVELPASFTATVNAEMRVGAMEETLTVTGEAPTVDIRNVTTQQVIPQQLVETLPTTRTSALTGLAPTIPGVVGGLGQQSVASTSMSIHGSRAGEANLTIDGFPVRVIYTMQTYYWPNQGTVQEVVVQTEGQSAEVQLGSIWMNSVPKEGGNRFSGSLFGLYGDHNMATNNLTDDLKAKGLTSVNSLDRQWEFSPTFGGPIVNDKLWFYAAYQQNPIRTILANNYYNKNPRGWKYEPDLDRPAFIQIRNYSKELRLTWQVTPRNKVSLAYDHTPHYTDQRGFSSLASPEATAYAPYLPMWFGTGTWRSTVTNRLLLEAGYGQQISNIDNRRQFIGLDQEVGYDIIAARDQSGRLFRAAGISTPSYSDDPSYVYMGRASASYITGSHSYKAGMSLVRGSDARGSDLNGAITYSLVNDKPSSLTVFATPFVADAKVNADLGLYAQDQWAIGHLTLNYGLRFEYLNASANATDLPAGRFVPARHFDGLDNVPNWKDIMPRIGAAYDLGGDGRTAVKASVGKFVEFEANNIARALHGVTRSVTSATRTWADSNSDFNPDCDFSNPNANGECGRLSNLNFGLNNPNATTWDTDLTEGSGVRPYAWTTSIALQRQLMDGVSVTGGYYRRSFGNFRANDNTRVVPDDFSPYCITAPVDSRLPSDVSGQQICGLYDVSVAKFGQSQSNTTAASNFGKQTEVYNGFDVTTSIRARGVNLNGGVSTGRTATSACFVVDSPQDLRFCESKPPFQPNIKFNGLYTLPWWDIQTSFVYQNLPGSPISALYTAQNAEIKPTLGRDLSSGATGTVSVQLIEPGTKFHPRVSLVDFRVLKNITVRRYRVQGTVQIYNLFNQSGIQTYNANFGTATSNAAWDRPTLILQGRQFQLTAMISF